MANPTQNANALTFAQDIIAFAAQSRSLLAFAQSIQDRQSSHNYAALLQAMPTYTPDAGGNPPTTTVGGVISITPDAVPNQGHPIVALNCDFFDLDQARIKLVNDLVAVLSGSAAVAQADRRPQINALLP